MTDERHGHAPTPHESDDPLDREIRRLLAVDPSAAFEARVRARVAAEPTRNAWRAGRPWMTLGTVTAALVLAVAVFRPESPADTVGGSGLGDARAGGTAPPPSGVATRVVRDDPAAISSPVGLVETGAAPEPAFESRADGNSPAPAAAPPGPPRFTRVVFSESETAAGEPRADGNPPAPAAAPPGPPRFTRVVFSESETAAGEPRAAGNPPAPATTPPAPPRFTRVVFSESEMAALRRLLSPAAGRPVIVAVPVEARTPAAGEPPAELVIPLIAIEPRAEVVIPPIAIEPPITIEPLNVALLDTGADQ